MFSHREFAEKLSKSLRRYKKTEGIVIGINGPWGSGKSTILALLEHYLKTDLDSDAYPIVVHFNPWWFSGKGSLLLAFLHQISAGIGGEDDNFKKLKTNFLKFGSTILKSAGAVWRPFEVIGQLVEDGHDNFQQQEVDPNHVRKELEADLRDMPEPIIVVIDDVDRLLPDETRELFAMVKGVLGFCLS